MLLLGSPGRDGSALTRESRFELGSVTKALTGSLLARLAVQGRVGLDDPVQRWLSPLAGTSAGRLTLRSLATHRSGLPRLPMSARFLFSMLRDPGDPYRHYTEVDMLAWLRDWEAPAQTEFAYSNLGFALLGLVLERAAGQPLARLMDTEILQPAGAAGAGLDESLAGGQIQGYDERGRPTPAWTIGTFAGAGALRADTTQMLALLDAARLRRPPFNAGAEREQARRNTHGAVGLGWMRTERHGDRIVWHNGGTGGFRSFFGYSELSGRAVLLMANGHPELDSMGMHLLNADFKVAPASTARATGRPVWIGLLIGSLTLASLAWRALHPHSRLEQVLEGMVSAALLALAWRFSSSADPVVLAVAASTAALLGGWMLWRGRSMPAWPRGKRHLLTALLSAAGGLLLVAFLW